MFRVFAFLFSFLYFSATSFIYVCLLFFLLIVAYYVIYCRYNHFVMYFPSRSNLNLQVVNSLVQVNNLIKRCTLVLMVMDIFNLINLFLLIVTTISAFRSAVLPEDELITVKRLSVVTINSG